MWNLSVSLRCMKKFSLYRVFLFFRFLWLRSSGNIFSIYRRDRSRTAFKAFSLSVLQQIFLYIEVINSSSIFLAQ
jgi:hypothetical protein